jgi:spore coat protein U-like protein
MKSKILAAGMAAAVLAAPAAMAAGTHTLNVSATVNGTCSFDLPSSPMAFGAIDPAGVTPATATATVDFHCTTGQAYTVTLSGGGAYTLTSGLNSLPYTASITGGASGTGTGMAGAASSVSVGATIAVTDFAHANAGAYTGTLTLNVAP